MNNPDLLSELYSFFVYFLACIGLFQSGVLRNVKSCSHLLVLLVLFVCIAIFGLTPEDASAAVDRENYQIFYLNVNNTFYSSNITETGFLYFCKIGRLLFGRSVTLFFLSCATLYIFAYNKAIKLLSGNRFYTWLICLLSMGFMAYSVNTMREGLGIAFFLLGICSYLNQKRFSFIAYSLIACSIHISLTLPVICFVIASRKLKINHCFYIWIGFFFLSLFGLSEFVTQVTEFLQIEKLSGYLNNADTERYKVGFRWDFVLYSLLSIIWGGYMIYRFKYTNSIYIILYKTYILVNAVWLLFIKIPFTDRIAYLSWFLMPFLVTIPIVDRNSNVEAKPAFMAIVIMIVLLVRIII